MVDLDRLGTDRRLWSNSGYRLVTCSKQQSWQAISKKLQRFISPFLCGRAGTRMLLSVEISANQLQHQLS